MFRHPGNTQTLPGNLTALLSHHDCKSLEYQSPDEYRLSQQLQSFCAVELNGAGISTCEVDSDHFYTQRHEAATLFASRKQWLMEYFYRHMRVRHRVLIDGLDKPAGGQWNLGADNRKPWKGSPPEPPDTRPLHDHSRRLRRHASKALATRRRCTAGTWASASMPLSGWSCPTPWA